MQLVSQLCGGGLVIAFGLMLYLFYRWNVENAGKLNWLEVPFVIIIGLIAVAILTVGDRILAWETLPDLVRWIIIGIFWIIGISSYFYLYIASKDETVMDKDDEQGFLILYFVLLFFLLIAFGLTLSEFGLA
jgi:hypothetical protein